MDLPNFSSSSQSTSSYSAVGTGLVFPPQPACQAIFNTPTYQSMNIFQLQPPNPLVDLFSQTQAMNNFSQILPRTQAKNTLPTILPTTPGVLKSTRAQSTTQAKKKVSRKPPTTQATKKVSRKPPTTQATKKVSGKPSTTRATKKVSRTPTTKSKNNSTLTLSEVKAINSFFQTQNVTAPLTIFSSATAVPQTTGSFQHQPMVLSSNPFPQTVMGVAGLSSQTVPAASASHSPHPAQQATPTAQPVFSSQPSHVTTPYFLHANPVGLNPGQVSLAPPVTNGMGPASQSQSGVPAPNHFSAPTYAAVNVQQLFQGGHGNQNSVQTYQGGPFPPATDPPSQANPASPAVGGGFATELLCSATSDQSSADSLIVTPDPVPAALNAFVDFDTIYRAAAANEWTPELSKVTDWELMSPEQESALLNMCYDHRAWWLMVKMLDAGLGTHCITPLLKRTADCDDPKQWPKFAEHLFLVQRIMGNGGRGVELSDEDAAQMVLTLLELHWAGDEFWGLVPEALELLIDYEKLMSMKAYLFVREEEVETVEKLVQKWDIIVTALSLCKSLKANIRDHISGEGMLAVELGFLFLLAQETGESIVKDVPRRLMRILDKKKRS